MVRRADDEIAGREREGHGFTTRVITTAHAQRERCLRSTSIRRRSRGGEVGKQFSCLTWLQGDAQQFVALVIVNSWSTTP